MGICQKKKMMYSWGSARIIGKDGAVSRVELVRCTSVFDESGKFCPFFDDTKETVETDQVILAIGQACDFDTCELEGNVRVAGNLIAIDKDTQETEVPGVFAGGDVANGPGAVVDAVAAGRRAAVSIDKYLGGDGVVVSEYATLSLDVYDPQREKGLAELKREHFAHLPLDHRHQGFAEVDQCFSADQAKKEAHRCFQCDYEVCMARAARATAASAK